MSRDIGDRLDLFTEQAGVYVNRIALNMPQIRRHRPPPNPAKLTDSRAKKYIRQFGRSSWELDALEPSTLASLVRAAIKELIAEDQWEASGKVEDKMRLELRNMSDDYERKQQRRRR